MTHEQTVPRKPGEVDQNASALDAMFRDAVNAQGARTGPRFGAAPLPR